MAGVVRIDPFYRQPERATFQRWRRAVPDNFVYAVKLKLPFDPGCLARFFAAVAPRRKRHALEPRDSSWLTDGAIAVLR